MDERRKLNFGSLFAGIGGFDLGLEQAGMQCKWQVECDKWASKVLAKHWPNVHRERDVRDCGNHNLEWVDVICGGFPCQDISIAGKGAGLAGKRSGLWSEFARIIGELRPRYVIVENVAALLARGMGTVLGDLSSLGYDAEWHVIPACAVGAPHRRERIWIVAYPSCKRLEGQREIPFGTCKKHEDIGYSRWWAIESAVDRVAHGIPNRMDRLRGLGNAVVPQIVEQIGKFIIRHAENE